LWRGDTVTPEQQQVAELRQQLWRNGFRSVPCLTGDKVPLGKDWPDRARQDPPECLQWDPVPHALNTGLLTDALRLIDIDIDATALAEQAATVVIRHLGEAPTRFRSDSPRRCLMYRAAVGQPPKRALAGTHGKVEILGRGQQCLAFGRHPSGAELEWTINPANQITLVDLPVVTEEQIAALLEDLAPLIGAAAPASSGGLFDGGDVDSSNGAGSVDPAASIERIVALLAEIPNVGPPNWESWNRTGLAVWRATSGSLEGLAAWTLWSVRNPHCGSQDPAAALRQGRRAKADTCAARWKHYATSPPNLIGVASLVGMAADARQKRLGDFVDLGMQRSAAALAARGEPHADNGEDLQQRAQDNDKWERAAEPPELPQLPPEPDWPEPIGREAYRGLLGEIVDATAPTTEADRNAILIQHLVMFGSAIGIGDTTPYHVIGNGGIHRTNLFTLIVGESAYSRKGTSTSDVSVIYAKVDGTWLKDHVKRGLSSGEGLIYAVRDERWGLDKDGNLVRVDEGSKTSQTYLKFLA
jgi:hypothetical protein